MFSIVFGDFTGTFDFLVPPAAEAANGTIDATVDTTALGNLHAGPQTVFTTDLIGYRFYRDSSGECVYSKTSNAGGSWGAAVLVDDRGNAVDCVGIAVWYDQWTPNATSGQAYIHVATMSSKDVLYNRVDTANSDTRLGGSTAISASTSTLQVGTYVAGANYPSITRGTDGTLYISADDTSDSFVVRCSATSTSCGSTTDWSEAMSRPQDLANDYSILQPLINGHIMLINRDISAEDIRSKIWNNATWTAAWTLIDAGAADNTTYDVGLAAVTASSTSVATTTTLLVYTAENATLGTTNDIRTARYSDGRWATSTTGAATSTVNVTNNDAKGITNVAIGMEKDTSNVYVAYTARTTPLTAATGNVYWKMSTTSMSSWTSEAGPSNATTSDLYAIDLNLISDQRLFMSWDDVTADDLYGDTLFDLVPGIIVSTSSSQVAEIMASTTNFYIGSAFVFDESVISNRTVTDIMIEENGSIDAQNDLSNIRLLYESDTTFPYDCNSVSYDGTELQFGATSTSFTGANGSSTFTGSATVGTSSALCVYPVMDILESANDGDTINIFMNAPSVNVVATTGDVAPTTLLDMVGSTTVKNDNLTLLHFHWRNDDGTETTATSRTSSVEDTSLTSLQQSTPVRLRLEVSNEGGTTSAAISYRLEYSIATSTCDVAYLWTDVGSVADEWDMYNTANLTDGDNTTNIALAVNGAVSDGNISFITPNAAVKDTSSQTSAITATSTQFIELEYSIVASTTAAEGNTYCFRLTDKGNVLRTYSLYPRASIAADVSVTATSSQILSADVPTTTVYIGGAYVITENSGSRNVTGITITEDGSIDASTGISNVRLLYDLDTSAPYDCSSEVYNGNELQYGATSTSGFTSADGTATFNGTVTITTTATMCVYTVLDVTESALNQQTINVVIQSAATDVVVSGGGTVSPTVTRDITGSTTLRAAVLTQLRYHWRNEGLEASSTSRTNGLEGTAAPSLYDSTPVRLRVEVSNEGVTSTPSTRFRIEYGQKISTCSAVASWTDVGDALGAWDMYDSPNFTNGTNTTDISVLAGGVTNENTTFKTPNGGLVDTTSLVASTTLSETQFIELEYSMKQTTDAGYSTPYCFRVTKNGTELEGGYSLYPELTTAPERDFKVQHGTTTVTGTATTIVAGVDYIAPAASTSAFIRITNTGYTGAGSIAGGTQNADDVTAYILNPWNIATSVTFQRPALATNNTRISWEIVEFTGKAGSDNEIIVRQQQAVTFGVNTPADLFATGTPVSTVASSSKVVVFITGQLNPDAAAANYNTGQAVASWVPTTSVAVFQRGEVGSDAAIISYAVVEFVGQNWNVQRIAHTYTQAGGVDTEPITAVNSTTRTFIHTQKFMGTGLNGTDEFGHEVWLSGVGQLSFRLEPGATTPSGQRAVAWVIENTQTSTGAMVVTRTFGTTTAVQTVGVDFVTNVVDIENSSLFINNRGSLTTQIYPRPILGAILATSTRHFQIWRSNNGATAMFRAEIVEWPVAGTVLRQNDYQFFADNNALDPTDIWPPGAGTLGENTVLTGDNQPLGSDEHIRIRMSISVINSSLPENSQAFKLQYGERGVSCSAISAGNWFDLGDAASTTALWRGFNATGTVDGTALSTDPPTGGDLNLSQTDVAGTLEEENDSAVTPYRAEENEDIEYDWIVQQNGAVASTTYCFRMVDTAGGTLNQYLDYPQIKTADFDPATQNWRWYDDENNETPTSDLANENITPTDVVASNTVKLRISVRERENVAPSNARFTLQFSEYSTFSTSSEVLATTSCVGTTEWCFANGGGSDNAVISTGILSDSDTCVAGVGRGCGTHTESTSTLTGYMQTASSTAEYEFTIRSAGARVNRVYYFRLYDVVRGAAVPINTGESYPSLATQGAQLTMSSTGIATTTTLEGVTTDIATTPSSISYGILPPNTQLEAAQRFTVTTNATEGYQLLMYAGSPFMSAGGDTIAGVAASNTAPLGWSTGCSALAPGCYGYHVGDDTLAGGNSRFAPDDTYAAFETVSREVGYSSIPVTNDQVDIVYRVIARDMQPAGQYETDITFISVPAF